MRFLGLFGVLLPATALSQGLVGPETCKACHPQAYDAWRETAHARASDAVPAASRADPRCTACHAPEQERGVSGVSCETCHGPGQLYAANHVMRDHELARLVGLLDPGERTCLRCHNDSTPSLERFDYARRLPLIEHGGDKRAHRAEPPRPAPTRSP
ncbi:MAG TPA: multiheme c-type cytochrome [Anaeromyxobacteraceae bacterium]|nr:multiheme c-type cytochrome [Anaeromyxobacteraceae bacterium]